MPKIIKFNAKLISSLVMMIIIAALLVAATFAWFSHNERVHASGMAVRVDDTRITLSDTLTVTRTLSSTVTVQTYKCEGEEPYYFLFEDGAYATDEDGEKIPFSISGLLPGETVDVTFSYTCDDGLIGKSIGAELSGITAATFTEIDHPDVEHSVLGVYKYSVDTDGSFGEEHWLVDYVSGTSDPAPETIPLFIGEVWEKVSETPEDNYKTVTFRFDFDLEQYYTLRTLTNQLSEKSFTIGELRIEVQ